MTAGMPGTGIGGLFYLIAALLMPLRELWRAATGRSTADRRRNVLRQSLLSAGILGAVAASGVLLSRLPSVALGPGRSSDALRTFYVAPVVVAFGTLLAVLVAVEVAHLVWARGDRAAATADPAAATETREAA